MKRVLLLTLALLLVAAVLLATVGRPAYRKYRERRAVVRAQEFIRSGDLRNAALSARQALALNGSNLPACRIMADLAEAAASPQALQWRRRIAEVEPTPENKLQLAAAALKVEPSPCPTAVDALRGVPPEATNRPAFHVLSADLALKQSQPAVAAAHFLEAQRLEPANPLHRLNAAVLSLPSSDSAAARRARETLERLAADTNSTANISHLALRWLASDALRRGAPAVAHAFSDRLIADSRANFQDQLQHLDILHQENSRDLAPFLNAVQQKASTNSVAAQQVAAWMVRNELAAQAAAWLTNLPSNVRIQQPVPLAIAEAFAAASNWTALQGCLQPTNWTEGDFLRLAWLSRAASQLNQTVAADANWRLAVHGAGDRLPALTALAALARSWRLQKPLEDILWRIVSVFPREQWAVIELDRLCTDAGNTRGLHKLYSTLLSSPAADTTVRNNFAATSMLLNLNLEKAFTLAKENVEQTPNDPVIVSTYALSLHLQGQTSGALAALEQLDAETLRRHPLALYYGVLLAAGGQGNKAATYLDAVRVTELLPEEKGLLDKARSQVAAAK